MNLVLEINGYYFAAPMSGAQADDFVAALNTFRRVDNPYTMRSDKKVVVNEDGVAYDINIVSHPIVPVAPVVEVLAEAKDPNVDPHLEAVAGPDEAHDKDFPF